MKFSLIFDMRVLFKFLNMYEVICVMLSEVSQLPKTNMFSLMCGNQHRIQKICKTETDIL